MENLILIQLILSKIRSYLIIKFLIATSYVNDDIDTGLTTVERRYGRRL